jgi:phenylacetate-CoA ligase
VHQQAEWLQRSGAHYLHSFPAVVGSLAREVIEQGAGRLKLEGILTFGEAVTAGLRERCRSAFDCEIFDTYSAGECGYLAIQCPLDLHYHLASEAALVEVVGEHGAPCSPGEVGRVLATPLFNYAMPLIRYVVGDLAVPGQPCRCGRILPVLERIAGRERHAFRLPGRGRVVPDFQFLNQLAVRQWQVAQIAPLAIEVRIVPERPERIWDEAALTARIRDTLHSDVSVTYTRLPAIPRPASGKVIDYVCEL